MKKFFIALPFILLVLWFLAAPYIIGVGYDQDGIMTMIVLAIPLLAIIWLESICLFVRAAFRHNVKRVLRDRDLWED